MPHSSQSFLKELDQKLWTAADRLRTNLDAAVYKHAVLGLIFLKYGSDSFVVRQAEIEAQLRDPESDYFLDPADFGDEDSAEYREAIHAELEERDYYLEKNVFWVPALARWKTLQDSAKLPPGTEIEVRNGKTTAYKITSTGKLIDDALNAIEKENPKLKGVLNKTYTQLQLDSANLSSLIDLIAPIPFEHAELHAKEILGHAYGPIGATQTHLRVRARVPSILPPKSNAGLFVDMIEIYQGHAYYDTMGCCGVFLHPARLLRCTRRTTSRRSVDGNRQHG